jgi:fibronectin type 3 domain-containing protein
MAPYQTFYSQVAQAVRAAGLKLIVEDNVLLSDDISSGWTNLTAFYATLNWNQYMAARATNAATVAQTMQPDYLVLGEEPDGEAKQAGQPNVNIPADAAQMISGEITAVRAVNPPQPNLKLGAGFGSWLGVTPPGDLVDYILAYTALPLDYIDFHVYPVNTESQASFIANTLIIASMAAAAGKPVAISEAFLWKMEDSEWNVLNGQDFRARQPFSFWGPSDTYFMQTMQALAQYTNMIYMAPEGPQYLFAYQTYGGTAANGGAANCTCTTDTCNQTDIVQTQNTVSTAANQVGAYSVLGLSYAAQLIAPPDVVPPSMPTNLTGSAGYTSANFTWTASTDNIGIAGYNVYRCNPPAAGQPCSFAQIADTTVTSYIDSGLTSNTPYNYQVQAFDLANNRSLGSATLSVTTLRTSAGSPTNVVATAVSPKQVTVTWSPPTDTTGLTTYLIFSGSSFSNLVQIAKVPSSTTTFQNQPLNPSTMYFYGVEAVESGIDSAMSNITTATTLPLPNSPTNVVGTPSAATRIVLTWQETTAKGGLPVSSYQVFSGTTPGQLTKIARAKTTTYTNSSLTPGTTYYYEIVAVDTSNDLSVPSVEISVTTPTLPSVPANLAATTPAATQARSPSLGSGLKVRAVCRSPDTWSIAVPRLPP